MQTDGHPGTIEFETNRPICNILGFDVIFIPCNSLGRAVPPGPSVPPRTLECEAA